MTDNLPTPALLLDRNRLDFNIARMAAQMARLGVPLRPHVKTAKSIEVVRRAPPPELPVGTQLRILPNHACATAEQHDRYHVLAGGLLDAQWPRFGGW